MSGKCAELLAELRGELRGAESCARRTIKIDEPSMALWSYSSLPTTPHCMSSPRRESVATAAYTTRITQTSLYASTRGSTVHAYLLKWTTRSIGE